MIPFRRLPFILTTLLLVASPAFAASKPTSTADAGASDDIASSLLSAMKAQNYAAAYAMFDETMKSAVSEEKLRAVWSAQVGTLGPLVSWTITQRTQAQGLDIRIALLKFDHGQLLATVAIHPDTHELAGFVIKPAPSSAKPAPPAPYVHPTDFRDSQISIGTAPFVLGATLTEPVGLGPFPAVVLVHGSGPQDRDETIGGNKVFKDLAEGLASRGIVVLRYDKRTFVYGAKLSDSISVDDEVVVDAVAAVAALRARPEIDPQRLFVIGHSLGALLAPEIGVRSAPVAGVVLLAPPARPMEDMVLAQMKYLGASTKDMAELSEKVARLKAGTLGSDRLLGAPQSYWKDVDRRDGIAMARKLGRPVLVLRGDRDYQVGAEDMDLWRKGLAGAPGAEVVVLPGLNHLFIAGEGKPGPAEYDTPGHVDARVIDKVAAFVAPR
jgi:dienelactone hydrolase